MIQTRLKKKYKQKYKLKYTLNNGKIGKKNSNLF